jgi:hypothetical protein
VTQRSEFGDQFLEVVDLAVEDHHDATVLVVQGLLTRSDIDDRQAPVAKTDPGLNVITTVIRAAVMLRLIHANKNVALDSLGLPGFEDSCDAAHCVDDSL